MTAVAAAPTAAGTSALLEATGLHAGYGNVEVVRGLDLRVEPGEIDWLMGPFGHVDVIGDRFIQRLAAAEGLTIERRAGSAGLLPSVDAFGLDPDARARLRPEIAAFYERTADYHLEVWTEWNPLFCPFGGLLHWLYSRRLEQLNMPLSPLETARGISSEIIRLRCPASGGVR